MAALASQIAANWTDASYLDDLNKDWSTLRFQLEQGSSQERRDALKRVLALTVQGQPMSKLFPAVVSNLLQPDYELKRLVYIYLQQYADSEPQLVLLAVNALYKDLQHTDPWIRSQALRQLTSLRVPALRQIMWLAIHRGVRDRHAAVRRAAALAIPAVLIWTELGEQDPSTRPVTMPAEIVASAMTAPLWQLLLNDADVSVLAATVAALGILDRGAKLKITPAVVDRLVHGALVIEPALLPIILHHLLRHVRLQLAAVQESSGDGPPRAELGHLREAVRRLARVCLRSLSGAVSMAGAATLYHLRNTSDDSVVDDTVRTLLRYAQHRESGLQLIALRLLHIVGLREPARLIQHTLMCIPLIGEGEWRVHRHQFGILVALTKLDKTLAPRAINWLDSCLESADDGLAVLAVQALGVILATHAEYEQVSIERLYRCWHKRRAWSLQVRAAVGRLLLRTASKALGHARRWHSLDPRDILKEIVLDASWFDADPGAQAYMLWTLGTMCEAVGTVADEVLRQWMLHQHRVAAASVRLELIRLAWKLSRARPQDSRVRRALHSLLVAGLEDTDVDVFDYAAELVQHLRETPTLAERHASVPNGQAIATEPNELSASRDLCVAAIALYQTADEATFALPPGWLRGCLLCAMTEISDSASASVSCLPDLTNLPETTCAAEVATLPTEAPTVPLRYSEVPCEMGPSTATDPLDAFFGEQSTSMTATTTRTVSAKAPEPLIGTSSVTVAQAASTNPISSGLANTSFFDALLDAGLVPRDRAEHLRPRVLDENNLDALFDELIAAASAEVSPPVCLPESDIQAGESAGLLPAGLTSDKYEAPSSAGQVARTPPTLETEAESPSR
ncbi:AP-3 complex subunit beta [Cyanidiococcus yangmingshanensis]|uniref:AP-3 complex subunit beta n=1 Tax=Cyanidiococcus yangmingshanensis TaxID=2690220 RepID=A0A7J7IL58_9RHOD|nr:AP-3 complex subunit beta [Cyanidiococcus yangmingshanensis]